MKMNIHLILKKRIGNIQILKLRDHNNNKKINKIKNMLQKNKLTTHVMNIYIYIYIDKSDRMNI